MENNKDNKMSTFMSSRKEILLTGKYKVVRRIGGGSFGDIYLAINIANGEVNVHLRIKFLKIC